MDSQTAAREGKVEVWDDEDQERKLTEIVELLVAAGYFRARIKGLSPFDKVVGGMTWCIELCNIDVDIDLLFHENLTIGQKIALTEKIVRVLPSLKCPHKLEPHQIQGLDAIHIFPVVQWLVKTALETRTEYAEEIRAIAIDQFNRYFTHSKGQSKNEDLLKATESIKSLKATYGPKRSWRKRPGYEAKTRRDRVLTTLLEYENPSGKKEPLKGDLIGLSQPDIQTSQVSSQHIGAFMAETLDAFQTAEKHYSQLHEETATQLHDSTEAQVRSIGHQLAREERRLADSNTKANHLKARLEELQERNQRIVEEHDALVSNMTESEREALKELTGLVEAFEEAQKRETLFKEECRKEADVIHKEISALEQEVEVEEDGDISDLQALHDSEAKRFDHLQQQLHQKICKIDSLKRAIDDVPGRSELMQYHRRFMELYNQVNSTHCETLQFYNTHNTLVDIKALMEKELNLLNSILDNLELAMSSPSILEEYLQTLSSIQQGIEQNKLKLERQLTESKGEKASLCGELSYLHEVNRQYAKTVHQLAQELRRNEILTQRLQALSI